MRERIQTTDHAYVLFVDTVGYSQLSAVEQQQVIGRLERSALSVPGTDALRQRGALVWRDSGDGFALCFFHDLETPIQYAIAMAQQLRQRPELPVRFGIHTGVVIRGEKDALGNEKLYGDGINLACRVMDQAQGGQILLSTEYANALRRLSARWNTALHDRGSRTVKHGVVMEVVEFVPPQDRGMLVGKRVTLVYRRHLPNDGHVLKVVEAGLQQAGATVFVDTSIPGGVDWAGKIKAEVVGADFVIPLISETSMGSEMLTYEVTLAHETAQQHHGLQPRLVPLRVGYTGPLLPPLAALLDPIQYLLWNDPTDDERLLADLQRALSTPPPTPAFDLAEIGSGAGALPLDSKFYIERDADPVFQSVLERRDGIVLVKGPRQAGKTSLLARGLQRCREQQSRVVLTDFQTLNEENFTSLKSFYLHLARLITRKLGISATLQTSWEDDLSPNANFEYFLEDHVLSASDTPLVWGIDEADRLFATDFGGEVFALFRTWYNLRATEPDRQLARLTLVIAYATEAHLFISDLNQSPFNVGTKLSLDDFTREQVTELNRRYGNPLPGEWERERFWTLVGGHPFLVHRSLIEMVRHGRTIDDLERNADRDEGMFGDHLRRILVLLARDEPLLMVVRGLLNGQSPDEKSFLRLRSAGLLSGEDFRNPHFRCDIYRSYLQGHLS